MNEKELINKLAEKEEYINILESVAAKDTELINKLRKTINSLMAYKIKANIKINALKKQIKELEEKNDSK